MTQWHEESRRRPSGGMRTSRRRRDKRLTELSKEERRSKAKGRGFTHKVKQRRAKFASVVDPKTKKAEEAEIVTVAENNANRLFVRRNVITKGAIIKVKIGGKEEMAKVTSRPGQQGQVQAILIEQAKEAKQP